MRRQAATVHTGQRSTKEHGRRQRDERRRRLLLIASMPLIVGMLFLVQSVRAAESRITAEIDSQPEATLSTEEQRAVSIAAGRLLRHAYDAHVALDNDDLERAEREIALAETLVRILENAIPSATVTASISSGTLRYSDQDTVKPTLIPIHYELDMVSLTAPLSRARTADDGEEAESVTAIGVVDHELRDTRVTLDLLQANAGLQTARQALADKDPKTASQGLAAILHHSLRFSTITLDVPLHRAQDNLMLAKAAIAEGRHEQARYLLDEVVSSLNAYGQGSNSAESVVALRDAISSFAKNLDAETEHDAAAQAVDGWWNRLSEMTR